jgi:pimeloyl-ACP methyl ester carboxylesterase
MMRRRASPPLLIGLLLAAALLAGPAASPASASLSFVTCADSPGFTCASLAVPLDRVGALPGTVPLSIERRLSGAQPTRDALVALAGGPGQPVLGHASFIAKVMAPALASRDLLLFDQRGTGSSDPLSCSAFEQLSNATEAQLFERCALDIGPARGDFTTLESVNDIEAVRQAAGYEKLVLYGTSYGTKVALEYAERFPQHVEALVLDSVVPSDGEEPFFIPSYQAIAPALGELCSGGACTGITSNPTGDVARLAAQLHRHHLRGSVFDGAGHRHAATLDETDLFQTLTAGDLNPALRALLPAAVRSAMRHDPDPLLRLRLLSEGLIPNLPNTSASRGGLSLASSDQIDEALFATTICEETPFPWQRGAAPSTRIKEALAFLHAQAKGTFYPFDTTTAYEASLVQGCSRWPDASPSPPKQGSLPSVPTLIFSGAQDLRTPTAQAQRVASLIPGAQLEVVPFTGHSVVGSDLSHCSERAIAAFFAGTPVAPCSEASDQFAPTAITPTHLTAVHASRGLGGRPGKTLIAALETLIDLNRQIIGATLQANQELPTGASFGGLRGGFARLVPGAVVMHRFAFVPGVELSATLPVVHSELQTTTIHVTGAEAAGGSIRFGAPFRRVSGKLGGHSFSVSLAGVQLARVRREAASSTWPSLAAASRLLGRPDAAPGLR